MAVSTDHNDELHDDASVSVLFLWYECVARARLLQIGPGERTTDRY